MAVKLELSATQRDLCLTNYDNTISTRIPAAHSSILGWESVAERTVHRDHCAADVATHVYAYKHVFRAPCPLAMPCYEPPIFLFQQPCGAFCLQTVFSGEPELKLPSSTM
ncbi:collagen alpha-6(IV) chain [Platysternon megacephalum]|uniref:Collagen alpha-6(IV) chain n=1 Tax=Platysternon megacephalum TaxID=55544 RepID=A0A4D9F452_9SAUR|nr:collagen alpha-6(IV) chain [Platysternon megacephalum]